jgi:hypothetical protein
MLKRFLTGAMAAALCITALPAQALTPFETDVNAAIDAGLDHMRVNNWFTSVNNANGLGLLALLEKDVANGYAGLDAADQLRARQSACMLMASGTYGSRGSFYAYTHGQVLMALAVYASTGGPDSPDVNFSGLNCQTDPSHTVRNIMNVVVDQTLAAQANGSNGGCLGMWVYTGPGCDSSTTQFAVAGLSAAKGYYQKFGESADKARIGPIQTALDRTAAAYNANGDLMPAAYCTFDTCGAGGCKGHAYQSGSGYGSASNQQTASGTWGQLLGTGKNVNDPSVQAYLRWLRNAYNYDTNIYYESWDSFYFYYLWSSAKAYGLIAAADIPLAAGSIGPADIGTLPSVTACSRTRQVNRNPAVDPRPAPRGAGAAGYYAGTPKGWYYDYAYRLMGLQLGTGYFNNPNGSWSGGGYYADHAYAILVLQRSLGGICTDNDGDGICDDKDNCPAKANPVQEDGDKDGVGDVCDNCPAVANPDQKDSNGNGIGDACEIAKCDLDSDGDIDSVDIRVITGLRGKTVPPAPVAADYDGNKFINVNDARGCTLQCTRPKCATK